MDVNSNRPILISIGIKQSAQGLGHQAPEVLFNGFMLLAVLVTLLYRRRFTGRAKETQQAPSLSPSRPV